jgi:hypothetical protein
MLLLFQVEKLVSRVKEMERHAIDHPWRPQDLSSVNSSTSPPAHMRLVTLARQLEDQAHLKKSGDDRAVEERAVAGGGLGSRDLNVGAVISLDKRLRSLEMSVE